MESAALDRDRSVIISRYESAATEGFGSIDKQLTRRPPVRQPRPSSMRLTNDAILGFDHSSGAWSAEDGPSYSSIGFTTVDSAAKWLPSALSKVQLMRLLAADWSAQDSLPPNEVAIGNAIGVLRYLSEYDRQPKYVDPSVEEGICISFRNGRRYADIECFNSGEILAIVSDDSSDVAWNVLESGIRNAVVRINQFMAG